MGSLDPAIAISPQKTEMKPVADDYDDVHGHDCSDLGEDELSKHQDG